MKVEASIVIPTRYRVEELRELLCSVLTQTLPVEILVMDDGASNALSEMIRLEFPQVRYYRVGSGRGPAFQRNRGIELASQQIVFPVDDDTLFIAPRTIEQTLSEFDHPRVGAVGIPFINVRQDRKLQQRASIAGVQVAHAFVGASHAVKREVFLKVGGYREHFFYMGEEGDFCLRMMHAGYITRLGQADPIQHLESPRRDLGRAGFFGRQNDILFCWHNVPMPYFAPHLIATTSNGVREAIRKRCVGPMLRGITSGYLGFFRRWNERKPVSLEIYRLQRTLKKHGPRLLSDIEWRLPGLSSH